MYQVAFIILGDSSKKGIECCVEENYCPPLIEGMFQGVQRMWELSEIVRPYIRHVTVFL